VFGSHSADGVTVRQMAPLCFALLMKIKSLLKCAKNHVNHTNKSGRCEQCNIKVIQVYSFDNDRNSFS